MSKGSSSPMGGGCIAAVFSLAFGLPGIGISVFIFLINWKVLDQQKWIPIPVAIENFGQSKGGKSDSVELKYSYRFQGEVYESEGVGGSRMEVNGVDRELRDWSREMKGRIKNEAPIYAWVDPKNPARSTLIRSRPTALTYFLGIFTYSHGLLGMGLFFHSMGWFKRKKKFAKGKEINPRDPAMWDSQWQRGEVKSEGIGITVLLMIVGAVFYTNAYVIPSILAIWVRKPSEFESSWMKAPGIFFPILFLIGFAVVLYFLFRSIAGFRLKNVLRLLLPPERIYAGGAHSLRIKSTQQIPNRLRDASNWELRCMRDVDQKVEKNRENARKELCRLPVGCVVEGADSLRLDFELPQGVPATSENVSWELRGKDAHGVSSGLFRIPVAAVEIENPDVEKAVTVSDEEIEGMLEQESILTTHQLGEYKWVFQTGRNRKIWICELIASIVFLSGFAVGVFNFFFSALVGVLIFAVIGLAFLLAFVAHRWGKWELRMNASELSVRKEFPWMRRERRISLSSIDRFVPSRGNVRIHNQIYYWAGYQSPDQEKIQRISPLMGSHDRVRLFIHMLEKARQELQGKK